MKSVLKYPGAKNRLATWIIQHIPEHKVYIEPYFGSGAVFFNKKPAYNEIINDLDDKVCNFFKVLRDNPEKLIHMLRYTPYSRFEYIRAYSFNKTDDEVECARKFEICCWQGFGCGNRYQNGFRRGIGSNSPNPARAWKELPATLILAAERIKNAQIEQKDALELIKNVNDKKTFIYIDPPYLPNVRKKYLYNHELNIEEHRKLLEIINKSNCKIMISGYEHELYEEHLKGWEKVFKNTTAECSRPRKEVLWMNYKNINLLNQK